MGIILYSHVLKANFWDLNELCQGFAKIQTVGTITKPSETYK